MISFKNFLSKLSPQLFYLALALPAGLLTLLLIPPLLGADEEVHLFRAYQVAHGGVFAEERDGYVGGEIPSEVMEFYEEMYYEKYYQDSSHKYTAEEVLEFSDRTVNTGEQEFVRFDLAAVYNPINYLFISPALLLGETLGLPVLYIFWSGRLLNVLACVLVIFFAIRIATRFKWLIAGIGLMPMTIISIATITPDGITIAFSLLFFAYVISKVFSGGKSVATSWKDILALALISTLMVLSKQSYLVLTLLFFLIPGSSFPGGFLPKLQYFPQQRWGRVVGVMSVVFLPVLLSLIWSALVSGNYAPNNETTSVEVVNSILLNPLPYLSFIVFDLYRNSGGYFEQFFGKNRLLPTQLPFFFSLGYFLVLIKLAHLNLGNIPADLKNRLLKFSISISLLNYLFIMFALFIFWHSLLGQPSSGFQGRYLIPIAPLIFISLAAAFGKFMELKIHLPYQKALSVCFIIATLCAHLLGTIYTYY